MSTKQPVRTYRTVFAISAFFNLVLIAALLSMMVGNSRTAAPAQGVKVQLTAATITTTVTEQPTQAPTITSTPVKLPSPTATLMPTVLTITSTPTSTMTAASVMTLQTNTVTPVATQNMTVGTPLSDDSIVRCSGGSNGVYALNRDPDESHCAKLTSFDTDSAVFKIGKKQYGVTLYINATKLYAAFYLNGDVTISGSSCTLNGVTFTNEKTGDVALPSVGNLNSRLECDFDGMHIDVTGSAGR